jgi:hypothetical protein
MAESAKLVEVRKGGQSLRVHPSTLAAHEAIGWVAAAHEPGPAREQPAEIEAAAPKPNPPRDDAAARAGNPRRASAPGGSSRRAAGSS